MRGLFGEDVGCYFQDWDYRRIESDYILWKPKITWLELYLQVNDCKNFDTHTHVGCVAWAMMREKQHNGEIPGGPQDTKRAMEFWKMMFYLIIPPFRNFSVHDIIQECNSKRGLASRCDYLLGVSKNMGLDFRISVQVLDKRSKFYCPSVRQLLCDNLSLDELRAKVFYNKKP